MWGGLSPLRSSGLNRLVDFSGGYTRPTLCLLTGLRRPGRGDDTMETMKQMPTEPVKPVAADGRKHRASVEEDAVRCARAELGEAT